MSKWEDAYKTFDLDSLINRNKSLELETTDSDSSEFADRSQTLVDEIITKGNDPEYAIEPEDKFALPKQLNTIAGLRKKGFDNERIFKAMELEQAESESTGAIATEAEKDFEKPEIKPATARDLDLKTGKDNMWERLSNPTKAMYLAGGLKKLAGGTMMSLGVTRPQEARSFRGREGFQYNFGEISDEEAIGRTLNNPLFKQGQKLFRDGLLDFAKRPDLQPKDNFMDYEWSDPEFIASAIGQAVPSFLTYIAPSALTAIATRSPALTLSVTMGTAFGMETGSMYETAIGEGLSPSEASNVAITVGTINSLISLLPASTMFSKLGIGTAPINDILAKNVIKKQLFKNVGTKAFINGATEVVEELLQETTNIIAETQQLGIELNPDELVKRYQAVSIGAVAMGTPVGAISGGVQTVNDVKEGVAKKIVDDAQELITVRKTAEVITNDEANNYNINYDEGDGSRLLTEKEIKDTGYDVDLNNIPTVENEKGETLYAVKVKGETDSKGNISISSSADRSTLLEEVVESRVKQLRNSKNVQERALADKIEIWAKSVRKKASEMGLELRFSEEGEGNLELFSDAILYTIGGFKGLDQKFEDAIYVPEDISSEFVGVLGDMSDGTKVFDILKGQEKGIAPNQDFARAVNEEIVTQRYQAPAQKRGPPKAKRPKSKKSKQMTGDRNTDTPAFKKWFGNSVVQNDNKPVVMYHGSPYSFDKFATDEDGISWFSDNSELANVYARQRTQELQMSDYDGSAQIYPVYLKVENPLILTKDLNENISVEEFNDLTGVDVSNITQLQDSGDILAIWEFLAEPGVQNAIKKAGYDGVAGTESHRNKDFSMNQLMQGVLSEDSPISEQEVRKRLQSQYNKFATIAVFDNKQIKSVFNRGTFEENNANISFQLEPAQVQTAIDKYPPIIGTKKEAMIGALKKRLANPKTKDMGLPKNDVQIHELENGGVIVTGAGKNHDHFKMQVESILNEEEIIKSSNWYDEAYPEFEKQFGEDAIPAMMSWLISNQNASPSDALSNTFLAIEQLKADIPSFKKAGLNATQVKNIMSGDRATQGAGEKLFDFADSALSKRYRTIMQDDPIGLGPVAVDRHTFRDTGFVDAVLKNALMRLAVDKNAVKKILFDDPNNNGPTTTQYQQGVKKVNEWTEALNAEGWMGIEWTPAKVQAVGWTAMARLTGTSEGMSIPDSFAQQSPTIALEVEFGEGSVFDRKYGQAYKELTIKQSNKLVEDITKDIVPDLAKKMGLKVGDVTYNGTGGWGDNVNANMTIGIRGSNQAIAGFMNALGYVYEQSEIGRLNHVYGSNDLGMVVYSPELSNPSMQEMVYQILREETDTVLIPGYTSQKISDSVVGNNMPSMVIGSDGLVQDDINQYADGIEMAVERIRNELDIDVKFTLAGVKYESKENNWTKNPNGRKYRDAISQSFGKSLQNELDNNYRPRIQKRLQATFSKSKRKQLKSYQIVPDKDLASEYDAINRIDTPLDVTEEFAPESWKDFVPKGLGGTGMITKKGVGMAIQRRIFDSLDPIVSLQEDIKKAYLGDGNVREHMDVVLNAELSVGRIPELMRDFDKKAINGKNPDSFVSRLVNDIGISIDEFSEYLHAKHADIRNDHLGEDGASGMTNATAKRVRKELNQKYGLKNLNKYVKEFYDMFIKPEIKLRFEAGLISKQDYDNLTDPNTNPIAKNYVPLFREFDDQDFSFDSIRGAGFDVRGSEYQKAKGSKRVVKNIIVSATERMHSAIIRSEKNKVNQSLLSLVEAFPSTSYEVRGLRYKPNYNDKGEINYMVEMKTGTTEDGFDITPESTIHVKVDGKVKQIIFKGPQGLKMARSLKGLGMTQGFKVLNNFNAYLRYVNTIANPEFIISNFVRDLQTAGINITAEQGATIRNIALSPKNLKNAWKGVFNVSRTGEVNNEWAELYERMRLAGGKTGFFDLETIDEKIGTLESKLRDAEKDGSSIADGGRAILNFIQDLNEATESAVRLTLFKAMLDQGYSEKKSAMSAKNVTINFNRKGEWGPALNSAYLFANAGLQGSMRIFTVLKNSPKARKAVGGLVIMGIMESLYNNMASEDDDEYEKLPDWEKDNYFIARYGEGDKYFKMRLPYGFNVFKVAGNITGDMIWSNMSNKPFDKSNNAERFLNAVANSYSPVGTGPIEQVLMPTIVDPFIQLTTNKNFYGAPIVPETFGPPPPDATLAWENTNDAYKQTAQWWYKATGNKFRYDAEGNIIGGTYGPGDGWGDISPESLRNMTSYIGGGLGKYVVNTVMSGISLFNAEKKYDLNNTPLIRQFFGEFKKDSEKRIMYEFEFSSKRIIYTNEERNKYEQYVYDATRKGIITEEERIKKLNLMKKRQMEQGAER